jgi:hypothetical protein
MGDSLRRLLLALSVTAIVAAGASRGRRRAALALRRSAPTVAYRRWWCA